MAKLSDGRVLPDRVSESEEISRGRLREHFLLRLEIEHLEHGLRVTVRPLFTGSSGAARLDATVKFLVELREKQKYHVRILVALGIKEEQVTPGLDRLL